ncbi:hypothetical protein AB28_3680 [Raoultella ornithinolytica 2-156-04_S1_C2]|nr:hypothetical protein AB00_3675 [Raoultella ornithinolytica 2-156-04_S1_C1]KDX12447.1 hypothetical protein AB28_3680 [Raoultella ornithinolytica 2-156-04_S1_C2]
MTACLFTHVKVIMIIYQKHLLQDAFLCISNINPCILL